MRHYIHFCILLFVVSFVPVSIAQNLIKEFPGIPVLATYWFGYDNRGSGPYDSMKAMGVNFFIQGIDSIPNISSINTKSMKLVSINNAATNFIQYYTDAKYSVWNTVGLSGDTSYLQHDPTVMEQESSGSDSYIKLKGTAASAGFSGLLIWGPFYDQELKYYVDTGSVQYLAEFNLKLENNIPHQDSTLFVDNPFSSDVLCTLQITQSGQGSGFDLISTTIDSQLVVKRSDFTQLNQFKTFLLPYKLKDDPPPPASYPFDKSLYYSINRTNGVIPRTSRRYIQFKVIWTGNRNYLLSIENVNVSDQRGRDLKLPSSGALGHMSAHINNWPTSSTNIAGWLGIDEPNSYDDYEPMRIVDSLVNSLRRNQNVLYPLMGKWDGVYESHNNPWGTYGLSPWTEMSKRLNVSQLNVCQDQYYFDYPYQASDRLDYREENIRIAGDLNYKQAYNLNHDFGVSLQCGAIHRKQAVERDPESWELKYSANLALLYGAKFLSLYSYFAQEKMNDPGY